MMTPEANASGLVGNVMFLITNGGAHPPDKWAAVTAEFVADLVQIDVKSNSNPAAQARRAKPIFIDEMAASLEPIVALVMSDEQTRCTNGTVTNRNDPFSVDIRVASALSEVVSASQGTPFTSHFAKQDTKDAAEIILKQIFIDAANNQRSWFFDAQGI